MSKSYRCHREIPANLRELDTRALVGTKLRTATPATRKHIPAGLHPRRWGAIAGAEDRHTRYRRKKTCTEGHVNAISPHWAVTSRRPRAGDGGGGIPKGPR